LWRLPVELMVKDWPVGAEALDVNEFARGVTSLLIAGAGDTDCVVVVLWSCCLNAALSFRRLSTVASNSAIRARSFCGSPDRSSSFWLHLESSVLADKFEFGFMESVET
jgi:hypothetical protein